MQHHKERQKYRKTIDAARRGYIVQAIVNNFAPLLFLTFAAQFRLSLFEITLITTFNFGMQLAVDMISAKLIGVIGQRRAIVLAHLFAAIGIAGLAVFPFVLPNTLSGILLSVVIYASGGGIIEVMTSPIVQACPTDQKEKEMSLLHSFYSFGHAGIVLAATAFFRLFGIENWRYLAIVLACFPLINMVAFIKVPLYQIVKREEQTTLGTLIRQRKFWVLLMIMLCAGAAELAMAQWASAFFESAAGISKTLGDLFGTCLFALAMGIARVVLGKISTRTNLKKLMAVCGSICLLSFFGTAFFHNAFINLISCIACGFSIGIFWPGVTSLAGHFIPKGGMSLYAMLALSGDIGCTLGPTVVGYAASASGGNLHVGLGLATVFPIVALAGLFYLRKSDSF